MSALPRSFCTALLSILVFVAPAFGQAPATDDPAKLQQENQRLKAENQRLRQLLVDPARAATPVAPRAPIPPAGVPASAQAVPVLAEGKPLDHWLTTSSSKRHNSRCRYYHTSNGRACTADEGIACKICGG